MRDYDRDLQRGYEYDKYGQDLEDDEVQYSEEEVEEEYEDDNAQPTQEELEYLEIRQRLKEAARKRMRKENAAALGNTQEKKQQLTNDKFGSFFGPSKPDIVKRVIEERQSIIETQSLANMKKRTSAHRKEHVNGANGVVSGSEQRRPKVVNELKKKLQQLKDTRDYSLLLSDDADISALVKDPPIRAAAASYSDARSAQASLKGGSSSQKSMAAKVPLKSASAQVPLKSSSAISKPVKPVVVGRQDKSLPVKDRGIQNEGRLMSNKINKPVQRSSDPEKRFGSTSNSSKSPSGLKAAVQNSPSVASKKPIMSSRDHPYSSAKQHVPVRQKPQLSKPDPSVRTPQVEKRREFRFADKAKSAKQPPSSSKQQMVPPPKPAPSHRREENRKKELPLKRRRAQDDDPDDAISMIRNMFRYDPRKFGNEDDDSDMEANFEDIQREERRSAKIARKEDEIELKLIQEEERRERERMLAKRSKAHR